MPPFNAGGAAKATEKRIDGLERKVDEFEKLTRQIDVRAIAGVATAVADLTKRVTTLETLVKALGQASTASKGAGAVISAEAMARAGIMTDKEINKLLDDAYAKQNAVIVKEAKAMNQKLIVQGQELAKAAQDAGKAAVLDARVKALEAQMATALGRK
jgi:hypothetical protein